MLISKYFNSFTSYNILLLLIFSFSVNLIEAFSIINSLAYVFFHMLLIYLAMYYYRKTLFLIYFLYGLFIDLILINEIGPHLIVFMFILIFFSNTKKIFHLISANKIYLSILFALLVVFLLEMVISHLLYNIDINLYNLMKFILISILISYPVFFLFSKIDNLK